MDGAAPLLAPERPPVPRQPRDFALSAPWHMGQQTLKNWQLLPRELQDTILDLAVRLRPTRPRRHEDTSPLGIDVPTALSIARVSRDCYRRVIGFIYHRIHIERPSSLRGLQAALAARPNLGLLVKALHVGPVEKLSDNLWPVVGPVEDDSSRRMVLFTFLATDSLKPYWCCPQHPFHVPFPTKPSTQKNGFGPVKSVREAIDVALHALDVDILRKDHDQAGRNIGSDAWHVRLFEVQAAAEMYLLEMGRRDKESGDKYGKSTVYPRLILADQPPAVAPGEDVLLLSRSQLREHIGRPGAKTDHFDHPVLFARSGVEWSHGLGSEFVQGDNQRSSEQHDGQDVADCFAVQPNAASALANDVCDSLLFPLPSTATIGGVLGLVRSVLSLTPNVKSLSFTSYLERVVCGTRGPSQLSKLKSLTLGPQQSDCLEWLKLENSAISSLERLRLAGHLLAEDAVSCIVGDNDALPHLRVFQYSSSAKYPNDEAWQPWNIIDIVKRLCGLVPAETTTGLLSSPSTERRKRLRWSSDSDNEPQPDLPARRDHPLYIELRLHPQDAQDVLDSAPTNRMREAWRTGKPMPGSAVGDRIQVFSSRGFESSRFVEWAKLKASWEMQGEAEEWWDEGLTYASRAEEGELGQVSTPAA